MPRYFFDLKNGHRLIDPSGLDCRDDREATATAIIIAQQIALDAPGAASRHIAVLNSERRIDAPPRRATLIGAPAKETAPARGEYRGLSGTEQTFAREDCITSALQHYAFSIGGVFFVYA
jgi:hypothetical protein